MRWILITICFLLSLYAQAQVIDSTLQKESSLSNILESMAERNVDGTDFSDLTDELNALKDNPVNINSAKENEIKRLFFLNELQQRNLIAYVAKYGNILSIYELKLIEGFDEETINQTIPYISFSARPKEKLDWKKVFKYGKTDFTFRFYRQLQKSSRYTIPDSTGKSKNFYLGDPNNLFIRVQFKYKDVLKTGLIAEKDAGEPFGSHNDTLPKGFDFYSFHLYLNNIKHFKHIALGDYHIKLGQGLNLWTGFGMSKALGYIPSRKRAPCITPHASANETSFMRGVATTYNYRDFDLTGFLSYKKLDASLMAADTLAGTDEMIRSLQQTGYHRTISEINNKNQIGQAIFGTNLKYWGDKIHIGLTAFHIRHDKGFIMPTAIYRKFEPSLKENTYVGFDYGTRYKILALYGEASYQLHHGSAFLQGLTVTPSSRISLAVLYRNYAKNYYNLSGNAFGGASHNSNEHGLYAGINVYPFKKVFITAYADYYKFPWLAYRVDAPSSGTEYGIQGIYTFNKKARFITGYRYREKQQNLICDDAKTNAIALKLLQNLRFQMEFDALPWLGFQSRLEITTHTVNGKNAQTGYLIFQHIKIIPVTQKYRLYFRYTTFDNQSYDTRVYAYENDFAYAFSIPAFYGKGNAFYAMAQFNFYKSFSLGLRYAHTWYTKRYTSNEQDDEPNMLKSSIKVQLHYRF